MTINNFVTKPDMVSGHSNHAFHQKLRWIDGKIKNYNVASLDFSIRQQVRRSWQTGIMQLVHQQEVADEQRIFHGAGRNLKRLNDERDHVNAEDHDREESLYPKKVLRLSMTLMLRSGLWRACWRNAIRLKGLRLGSVGADTASPGTGTASTGAGTAAKASSVRV